MLLKQLKQLALSAPLRKAGLTRFYGSPAVCQSLTTSKVHTRLSRDDRRALVESFVNEYRETNAGKFPTLQAIHKEVGGSYYVVRDIFQELKLKPKASVPIVAKALSEVSVPLPNDTSSQTFNDPQSHSSAKALSEVSFPLPNDASSQTLNDPQSHSSAKALSELSVPLPNDAFSQTLNDPQSHSSAFNAEDLSPVVVDPMFQVGHPETIEIGSDQRQATIDSSHPNSEERNLQGNNLVITATHDKRETDKAPSKDVYSKWDSSTHPNSDDINLQGDNLVITDDKRETQTAPNCVVDSKLDSNAYFPETQKRIVSVESLKNSETEEEENLTHSGSQESKADLLEGAAVSENVVPTETRQVSERGIGEVKTEERSSAWSNIMSFAKEFANFWRKG